jgi:LytR cell envelope-related transcriptional attenuator
VNTGTTRIIIVAALVIAGVIVLANGFSGAGTTGALGGSGSSGPSHSISPSSGASHSKSPKPAVQHQKPKAVTFVVLNGTGALGLAAQFDTKLTDQGLTQGNPPGNAPTTGVRKTVLYYRGGDAAAQNRADAQWVADQFFPGAAVHQLASDFASTSLIGNANVIVVVGADAQTTG